MHKCPNEKRYIGITSRDVEERWKNGAGYSANKHFDNAIKKYGWNNIRHIILAQNVSKEVACFLEKKYIEIYDTTNREKGYNNSTGGEKPSEGMKHTDEAKAKIGFASKNQIRKKESIEKTRLHHIKKVKVYDLQLNLLMVCESLTEAEKETGVDNSNISACCKGRYKQFKGYVFKYFDDEPIEKPRTHRRPVNMYTLDGIYIKQFETVKEAANSIGATSTNILKCCKGKYKQSAGYIWKYA